MRRSASNRMWVMPVWTDPSPLSMTVVGCCLYCPLGCASLQFLARYSSLGSATEVRLFRGVRCPALGAGFDPRRAAPTGSSARAGVRAADGRPRSHPAPPQGRRSRTPRRRLHSRHGRSRMASSPLPRPPRCSHRANASSSSITGSSPPFPRWAMAAKGAITWLQAWSRSPSSPHAAATRAQRVSTPSSPAPATT